MSPVTETLTDAGLQDSHWGQRIIAAEKRGHFTLEDSSDAGNWVTCACGTVSNDIATEDCSGAPVDYFLHNLGRTFSIHVDDATCNPGFTVHESEFDLFDESINNAASVLVKIEQRAYELVLARRANKLRALRANQSV